MKIVTSISGGRTSAYLAANYPSDAIVFALVRIEDEKCRFPDDAVRRIVEDRIQAPFVATAEDDTIIYTILDLEQFLGRSIDWVSGPTYDWVLAHGGWLPNPLHRYCTKEMKVDPIFYWWAKKFGRDSPVKMNIGYRADEGKRANRMLERLNKDGFTETRGSLEKRPDGKNKWGSFAWRRPQFPLIEDGIKKDRINAFWADKPVRFADYNNCVGCFHRNPVFLKFMYDTHPAKMDWFRDQEGEKKRFWRSDVPYAKIKKMMPQTKLYPEDFSECDSGYCGI
jgi:hypothetical protein